MALACIDSISDKLNLMESNLEEDDRYLVKMLKVELRLLRTFFLFARKWSNHESLSSSLCSQHEQKLIFLNLRSSLSSVKNAVIQNEQELVFFLSFRLEDRLSSSELADKMAYFHSTMKSFKQAISEVYTSSGCLMQSSCFPPPVGDELMEFMESLVENLVDLVVHDQALQELIDLLEEKLSFLKIFIRLGVVRGVEHSQLERLLILSEDVAVNAAHISYLCMSHSHDRVVVNEMQLKISELLQKIKPVYPQVREMYFQVLKASKLNELSHSLTSEAQRYAVGDFIDSLLGSLWELLDWSNSHMEHVKHQRRMLYEGLKFLRNIIKKQPEKFNELHEKTKDLFGAMVTEAGIVIFSLYMHKMEPSWARAMDPALRNLLEKIKVIKVEVAEKYPAKSTFNFPGTTNELGFIDLLIENLKHLPRYKVDSNSFAMRRSQKVLEDLVFLRSFLENIVLQCNQDEKLQALWNRVIHVAYKVEFVIDTLIVNDISYSPSMLFDTIIEEIKPVKTEALEIDATEYVFEAQRGDKISSPLPSQGAVSTTNEVVVGFKDESQQIIDQLTRGSMQLDIVSIVGMPGLGKTTLAWKVYHDPSILYHFHFRAWCVVSQVYCKKDLLLKILVCIAPKHSNQYSKMEEDDLAEQLYKRLKRNRYFIVLDDVWGIEAWNVLEKSFPNDANGSRILLTSRLYEVALLVKPTGTPFRLRLLTDDESWELLQKKLVLKKGCTPALDVLGMQIARKCNGLPLMVVIIAGILATLEQVGWEEIAKRMSLKVICDTEQCMNILELSYRHLPNYLKPCFLYFGAFLRDQEIPVWRLVRLWIAEGFVQKNELKSLEDTAEDYIMALIRRSLVMVAKLNSMGGVKTCCVHDLLHEFCAAKAKQENFLQFVHGYDELLNFDEPYNLRRLCIYSQRKPFVRSRQFCPHVRSLLFLSLGAGRYATSENLLFIFRIKLLRVLDLGKVILGYTFPVEIAVLVLLRYLAIVGNMKDIPSSIANLSNLETFFLTSYNDHVSLPVTIWNMQKLRHLQVSADLVDLSLAKDKLECSSHLYNLHTFATPRLYLGRRMEKIMRKFPNIRKLKCVLDKSFGGWNKIVVMDFLSRLESLELILRSSNVHHIEFRFPLNLKKLTLQKFSLDIISTVGKLPNLEVLKIFGGGPDVLEMLGLEMWEMEEGEFPKLKFLKLGNLNIVKWIGSGEHFPCLEKLVLEEYLAFEELPSCLEYIPTLELIEVRWCPEPLTSLVQKIKEEQMDMGNVNMKIRILRENKYSSSGSD